MVGLRLTVFWGEDRDVCILDTRLDCIGLGGLGHWVMDLVGWLEFDGLDIYDLGDFRVRSAFVSDGPCRA